MCIHHYSGCNPKGRAQDHVSRLPRRPRYREKLIDIPWDLTPEVREYLTCLAYHRLGLVVEKSSGADVLGELFLRGTGEVLNGRILPEQTGRDHIDALIG